MAPPTLPTLPTRARLHPTQLPESRTLDLELGTGWFQLSVEATVDHTIRLALVADPDGETITLDMTAQDAAQIIEALGKALYVALEDREQADAVLIRRWEPVQDG